MLIIANAGQSWCYVLTHVAAQLCRIWAFHARTSSLCYDPTSYTNISQIQPIVKVREPKILRCHWLSQRRSSLNTTLHVVIPQSQYIISERCTITFESCERRQAGAIIRQKFLENPKLCLGISVRRTADGSVKSLVFSSLEHALVILAGHKVDLQPQDGTFEQMVTVGSGVTIGGFHLPRIALHVSRDFNIPLRGVDLSTLLSPSTRNPYSPNKFMKGCGILISNDAAFEDIWDCGLNEPDDRYAVLRAWMCACAMQACRLKIPSATYIETMKLSRTELLCLAKLLKESDLLYYSEPTQMDAEFDSITMTRDGDIAIVNTRYKTRIRKGQRLVVVITDDQGRKHHGRVKQVTGKTTLVSLAGKVTPSSIKVIGRQDPTNAERERDEFILHLLQGRTTLKEHPFIQLLWFQTTPPKKTKAGVHLDGKLLQGLNKSQKEVISAMLGETPATIVQGPPGTGKTTVIAHTTQIWAETALPTWIVAQSNVAVKNIAEKLAKLAIDFKLIVSKEFHYEWHEDLYFKLQENLIRSDEFADNKVGAERHLGGSQVILTTVSMLSNPLLEQNGTFNLVPMERLFIDEASQINVFEYMPLFAKFKKLKKVCFFGDPNQLAPFGEETVKSMESIFDITHFKNDTYFLNTQYRMPTPIGKFISTEVYGNRLYSEHSIKTKRCLAFIHADGEEETFGESKMNARECHAVIQLVKNYYQYSNFVVITAYDAQRAMIEKQLKAQNLPWESHVFNVDSFQGNEADIVIVSVVRTEGAGFLRNWNRINVMLTRCKKGMVIVTNRAFIFSNEGKNTLLGRLAQSWMTEKDSVWFDWRLVSDQKANLPGESLYRELGSAAHKQEKRFDVSKIVKKPRRPPDLESLKVFPFLSQPALCKERGTQSRYTTDLERDPKSSTGGMVPRRVSDNSPTMGGSTGKDSVWFDWRLVSERKAKLLGESLYRELDSAAHKQEKHFDVSKIVKKPRRPPCSPDLESLTSFPFPSQPALCKERGTQSRYTTDLGRDPKSSAGGMGSSSLR